MTAGGAVLAAGVVTTAGGVELADGVVEVGGVELGGCVCCPGVPGGVLLGGVDEGLGVGLVLVELGGVDDGLGDGEAEVVMVFGDGDG